MQRLQFIIVAVLVAILFAGCRTKSPPTHAEIQQQALPNITLTNAWKAGGSTNLIQDNWLATFNDEQLNALVREAMTNNPDLRVSAARVEQAEQYVELAKAALRPQVNIAGTGGFKGGGGSDVSSALARHHAGRLVGTGSLGPDALFPQCRAGNLRLRTGGFSVCAPVTRGDHRQKLVHRQ